MCKCDPTVLKKRKKLYNDLSLPVEFAHSSGTTGDNLCGATWNLRPQDVYFMQGSVAYACEKVFRLVPSIRKIVFTNTDQQLQMGYRHVPVSSSPQDLIPSTCPLVGSLDGSCEHQFSQDNASCSFSTATPNQKGSLIFNGDSDHQSRTSHYRKSPSSPSSSSSEDGTIPALWCENYSPPPSPRLSSPAQSLSDPVPSPASSRLTNKDYCVILSQMLGIKEIASVDTIDFYTEESQTMPTHQLNQEFEDETHPVHLLRDTKTDNLIARCRQVPISTMIKHEKRAMYQTEGEYVSLFDGQEFELTELETANHARDETKNHIDQRGDGALPKDSAIDMSENSGDLTTRTEQNVSVTGQDAALDIARDQPSEWPVIANNDHNLENCTPEENEAPPHQRTKKGIRGTELEDGNQDASSGRAILSSPNLGEALVDARSKKKRASTKQPQRRRKRQKLT